MFSEQMKAAALRALFGATIGAGAVFFAALNTDASWREIAAMTGAAFVGFGGWRTLAEGSWDTMRAATDRVQPSDVGAADALAHGREHPAHEPSRVRVERGRHVPPADEYGR